MFLYVSQYHILNVDNPAKIHGTMASGSYHQLYSCGHLSDMQSSQRRAGGTKISGIKDETFAKTRNARNAEKKEYLLENLKMNIPKEKESRFVFAAIFYYKF